MNARDAVVALIRRATGAHIYRVLPRGLDLYHDIVNALPHLTVKVVFDVGANVGQSAQRFAAEFPQASIWCFEPVPASFRELERAAAAGRSVRCFPMALGRENGRASIVVDGLPDMAHLRQSGNSDGATTQDVEVMTLDEFCGRENIARINYLKIDVEGSELDVLHGGRRMLEAQQVDLIELEAGMHSGNRHHTPCEAIKSFLEPRGYKLFGIYEQVTEWPTGRPELRRANLAFISEAVAERHRVPM